MQETTSYHNAVGLLKEMIAIPSFSTEEDKTADIIESFFLKKGVASNRRQNNVWVLNKYFDASKPTILLNSHHDTVRPNAGYTNDPFHPVIESGKLSGLGSTDAGASLVCMIAAFLKFYDEDSLQYNLILAATAEEEISGGNGIESILALLPQIDFAIVGEPTNTDLAIAEKGLLVLDCVAQGIAGHAAREEGMNAVYIAMKDINWFSTFQFPKISEQLGPVKVSVTSVHTENKSHNIVPATCNFVVDIRLTDVYTHHEVLAIIKQHVQSSIMPRSMRLRASKIDPDHPVVKAGIAMGKKVYGSPTTSDAALMSFPVLKCGPGDSARSHTANEFVYLQEIEDGISTYSGLLQALLFSKDSKQ